MKIGSMTLAAVSVLVALLTVGTTVYGGMNFFGAMSRVDSCHSGSPSYVTIERATATAKQFQDCVDRSAKNFIERDYVEAKDLAKTFLTLLSAILVASITFSEKIVDLATADQFSLVAMFACWGLLLTAIISCGTSLAFLSYALGNATYFPDYDYRLLEIFAAASIVAAATCFAFALACLIMAGVSSLRTRRAAAKNLSLARLLGTEETALPAIQRSLPS